MVRLSQSHKYALTSIVRKENISLLDRNLEAKAAAVTFGLFYPRACILLICFTFNYKIDGLQDTGLIES